VISGAASLSSPENLLSSTFLERYTADEEVSWSLGGTDGALMNINADGYLSFISSPDEDTKSSYLLNVLATDLSGNQASYPVSVTITADTTPPSIVCGTVLCPEQLVI